MNTKHKTGWTGLKGMALAVLALLSLLPPSAAGQELIREIPFNDNRSIIRYYDNQHWLIYSPKANNAFYIASPTATSINYNIISDYRIDIHDFEIYGDVVYFCGTYNDKDTQYALLGYFNLDMELSNPVYIDTFPYLASFDKLDVFSTEEQIQVIMTGRYHSGFGTMVNAIESSPGSGTWMYYYADLEERKYLFDDVAITDSYGVYTSRGDDDELKYGESFLWYFSRPSLSGIPLLQSNPMPKLHVHNQSTSPVLIEYMMEDSIAIASFSKHTHVSVSKFHGPYYVGTIEYAAYIEKDSVRDIKYNLNDYELDVLMGRTGDIVDHSISHLKGSLFTSGGMFFSYEFPEHSIESIDYMTMSPSMFVASGHGEESTYLHFYRYSCMSWGECAQQPMSYADVIEVGVDENDDYYAIYFYVRDFEETPTYNGEIEIDTKCGIRN